MRSAVGRTYYRKEGERLAKAWQKVGFTTTVYDSPAITSNKTIYTVYVNGHVPSIPGGEFELAYPTRGYNYSPPLAS